MTPDRDRLIGALLSGELRHNSAEEKEAREALAHLLCSSEPLDPGLQVLLGGAVRPSGASDGYIRFGRRRRGKHSRMTRDLEIAEFILLEQRAGAKPKQAIHRATTRFGLQERQVRQIWKRWRHATEVMHSDLESLVTHPRLRFIPK
jgi:hypothetical protein